MSGPRQSSGELEPSLAGDVHPEHQRSDQQRLVQESLGELQAAVAGSN